VEKGFGYTMIIPVRCMSCGKPVGQLWDDYNKRLKEGEEANKVLTDLGLERYCCRALFLSHIDLIDITAKFKKN